MQIPRLASLARDDGSLLSTRVFDYRTRTPFFQIPEMSRSAVMLVSGSPFSSTTFARDPSAIVPMPSSPKIRAGVPVAVRSTSAFDSPARA